MRWIKRLTVLVVGIMLLLTVGVFGYYHYKKPKYDAVVSASEIQQEVEVLYDEHGIPHIYAHHETDAYFALGYCHAKERLFQMEMLRRLACGELSELIGSKALEVDKFFRTLSLRHHAEATVKALYNNPADPVVAAAHAYYSGINYFQNHEKLPIEFDILGITSRPFSLVDGLVVAGYMGFSFGQAFDTEPINTYVLEKYGANRLSDLVTDWTAEMVRIPTQVTPASTDLLKLSLGMESVREYMQQLPPFHGSNSWILSGKRTLSGKPIFENDTHIGFAQPSVFFEAHLEYPGTSVYGNFIAGAPMPVLGHTAAGVWGLTMFENDDMDFYREKTDPTRPNQVQFRDSWEPIETREEIIRVKDSADVVLPVRRTRHGYLMNDAFQLFKSEQQPIALWWVWHTQNDEILRVFYEITHAKNTDDIRTAVAKIHAPGLNVMWADTSGSIAWWAAGRLPIRQAHVKPYLILDGASGNDEIEGWLPFDAHPHSINPASGWLYSANNQPEPMPGQISIPGYYCPDDRARRIVELLDNEKNDWTTDAVRALTLDHRNPTLAEVAGVLVEVLSDVTMPQPKKAAFEILKNWNGTHDLTDVAPTIFYRWLYFFERLTFADELHHPELLTRFLKSHTLKRSYLLLSGNAASEWFDDVRTPDRRETRHEIFELAWHQAIADLEKTLGKDPQKWQWQRVHTLTHTHPLGILPGLGKWFNVGPMPVPGGKETLNNLDFHPDSTGQNRVFVGPALRRVLDLAARDQAMSINPTGQSGHINSPFYDDQFEMYVRGAFRHEWTRRADVERHQTAKLIFRK